MGWDRFDTSILASCLPPWWTVMSQWKNYSQTTLQHCKSDFIPLNSGRIRWRHLWYKIENFSTIFRSLISDIKYFIKQNFWEAQEEGLNFLRSHWGDPVCSGCPWIQGKNHDSCPFISLLSFLKYLQGEKLRRTETGFTWDQGQRGFQDWNDFRLQA